MGPPTRDLVWTELDASNSNDADSLGTWVNEAFDYKKQNVAFKVDDLKSPSYITVSD